jgi:hypothetical protein
MGMCCRSFILTSPINATSYCNTIELCWSKLLFLSAYVPRVSFSFLAQESFTTIVSYFFSSLNTICSIAVSYIYNGSHLLLWHQHENNVAMTDFKTKHNNGDDVIGLVHARWDHFRNKTRSHNQNSRILVFYIHYILYCSGVIVSQVAPNSATASSTSAAYSNALK